jgi:thiamine-phosphate pyrophosphorylase
MPADFSKLFRIAAHLKARNGKKKLPALLFLTDPDRTPDPVAALQRLPRRADKNLAVIYRHFGHPGRVQIARKLKSLCVKRGWLLLIGADPALAACIRADGVHLPERLAGAAHALKRRRPNWIVTAAIHGPKAARRARGADALLMSPVFPTDSASAKGKKIWRRRGLARVAARATPPVYALGGINSKTINYLENIENVSGAALVSALINRNS